MIKPKFKPRSFECGNNYSTWYPIILNDVFPVLQKCLFFFKIGHESLIKAQEKCLIGGIETRAEII